MIKTACSNPGRAKILLKNSGPIILDNIANTGNKNIIANAIVVPNIYILNLQSLNPKYFIIMKLIVICMATNTAVMRKAIKTLLFDPL